MTKVTEKLKFVLGKVENTVGKGENAEEKILDWSKLKAFADDKIKVTEKLKFALGRVENTVGKGENAGYQHFLLFPQCFQKASFSGASKVGIANFHGHALSVLSLIKKSMKKSMSTVKAREFPEFGEHQLCVIANR